MKSVFDVTVPAQIGMRSYENENKALQQSILLNAGEYVATDPMQRWRVNNGGGKESNAVYRYRFTAEPQVFARIAEVLFDKFAHRHEVVRIGTPQQVTGLERLTS